MGSVVEDLRVSDPGLSRVWEKVREGERLDLETNELVDEPTDARIQVAAEALSLGPQ